jgi:organic hydroperoxide reductase OsmC/OhrA
VLAYEDEAHGRMVVQPNGAGKFEEVTLHPRVTIEGEKHAALAAQLHETAHEQCFIANSCSVPIRHAATVRTG